MLVPYQESLWKVVILHNLGIRIPHISGTVLCKVVWCNECGIGLLLAMFSGFSPLAWRMGYISYKRLYLFKDDYNILKNSGFLFLLIGCYQGLISSMLSLLRAHPVCLSLTFWTSWPSGRVCTVCDVGQCLIMTSDK